MQKYISGIINNQGQKLLVINSMPDHIHILIGMQPTIKISDLVRKLNQNLQGLLTRKK